MGPNINKENIELRALGTMVFTGSATIGVKSNGFKVHKILEISDEMVEQNAKHFIHNYPEIPVIVPSEWETTLYLENLKKEDYDLLYGNPPCSSLSAINRNAAVDGKNNVHFYRYFELVKAAKPKAFIIENAPTLLKLGKPILNDLVKMLGDEYNFTFIRDFAGNHNVAMKRQRTFIVGWRKDKFNGVPLLFVNKKMTFVKDILSDLYDLEVGDNSIPNFDLIENRSCQDVEFLFPDVPKNRSINYFICENYEKYESILPERYKKSIQNMLRKYREKKNFWDKSPARVNEEMWFPSMASVVELIHPIHDRQLTVREYARIMGYPDHFEFVKDCETPYVQCISQGVPVEFFKWISNEVKEALLGNREIIDTEVLYQHHGVTPIAQKYTKEEFIKTDDVVTIKKDKEKIKIEK